MESQVLVSSDPKWPSFSLEYGIRKQKLLERDFLRERGCSLRFLVISRALHSLVSLQKLLTLAISMQQNAGKCNPTSP